MQAIVSLPNAQKKNTIWCSFFVLALPILPVRLQTSIVGRSELNFRVRNGNGWTLALISTNYCRSVRLDKLFSGHTLKTEQ